MKRNKYLEKKSKALFYYFLALSIVVHAFILFEHSSTLATNIDANKGNVTYINFSLKHSGSENFSSPYKNKKIRTEQREKISDNGKISIVEKKLQKENIQEKNHSGSHASISRETAIKAVESYRKNILEKIHEMKYYPIYAKRMKQEGTVKVSFTIMRGGSLKGHVNVVNGCGHDILNRAGIKTIQKASPFPVFPDQVKGNEVTYNVDIVYDLDLDI